jgi:phage FluMu protein Com
MPADRALSCPRCTTQIEVAPLVMPLLDEASGEVTGAVLKRCPRCRTWSWMTPARQAAR